MNKSSLARKFARSYIDTLDEGADLDSIYNELTAIAELFKGSDEVQKFFLNPGIPLERKENALNEITEKAGISDITKAFLIVLLKKRALGILNEIAEQFLSFVDLAKNRTRAEVIVAEALDENEKNFLSSKLSEITGKEVIVKVSEDPSIIGGAITKIGSLVVDGSIKTQLKIAEEKLLS
ncbi:MAG: ATP synthase F1 subunit delta [Candidatus Schekmanbacteria bacterium]|nr:MAG: ATP synthase F1 subunit delta [Candidatus Schekmanbacteria bacterium]